ncbi:serine/threonine protein kinase [Nocardiopsis sp. Huas11]|uniref:serine/threonine-protein kinase n=1 Tax=Nocardiopsis sp. Huas11 TaxID=2183912 RepID=UPI000F0E0263|nr:serine/threonine-protein kinase [Nocardiopsis sp. Huas11]RKS07133.1 serine/threonine protein kinase [Nocardiopsis sp. Huas11]
MDAGVAEVGGYRLVRELGRGGFGSVYLGEAADGRRAAVKLLHTGPGVDPRFTEMFAREVEAARRISPFCVAQVLDADPHAERPWIASEYIEGRTLLAEIEAEGPRRGAGLQRLAISTATALTAIHRAGVAHRDLKPENIMMAPDGPRVIDFGIARAFEETAVFTATSRVGTLHYMAPERLDDALHLTTAVDVFAWGAVMVYAASGRHAFSGRTQTAVIRRILVEEPDCSAVPGELRGLVVRCLEKEPERRPTAHQVLDALLGHSGGVDGAGTDVEDSMERGSTAVTGIVAPEGAGLDRTLLETRRETAGPGNAAAAEAVGHVDDRPHREPPPGPPSGPQAGPSGPWEQPPGPWEPRPGPSGPRPGPSGPRPGPSTAPPFRFAGRLHRTLEELSETMHAHGSAAEAEFGDADRRALLAAWVIEDLADPRVDRSLFRAQPVDPALAVAGFVAQTRPDLAPRYRARDMRLSALREAAARGETGAADPGTAPPEVLEVMAEYDCRDPDHACVPGGGCTEYRDLVEDVRSARGDYTDAIAPYVRWQTASGLGHMGGPGERVADSEFVLAALAPQAWERTVAGDRDSLEESWRSGLPPMLPPEAPLRVRLVRGMVIRRLCRLLRELSAQYAHLGASADHLEGYVQEHAELRDRRARELTVRVALGAGLSVCGLLVLGGLALGGLIASVETAFLVGVIVAALGFVAYRAFGDIVGRTTGAPVSGQDPFPAVAGPRAKLAHARAAIADVDGRLAALDRVRAQLPRLSAAG